MPWNGPENAEVVQLTKTGIDQLYTLVRAARDHVRMRVTPHSRL